MESRTFSDLKIASFFDESEQINVENLSYNFAYPKESQNKDNKRTFYFNHDDISYEMQNQRKQDYVKHTTSLLSTNLDEEEIDSVHTGESLIKHFVFDTSRYNGDTNKCVAFWRTIMNETDLQPIKCTPQRECADNCTGREQKEDQEEPKEQYLWYPALLELQRRKMDEVALAAIDKKCKICTDVNSPYTEFKRKQSGQYSDAELKDYEDLVQLNNWVPKSVPKPAKIAPVKKSTIREVEEDPRIDCWQFDWPDEPQDTKLTQPPSHKELNKIEKSKDTQRTKQSKQRTEQSKQSKPTEPGVRIDCWQFDWPEDIPTQPDVRIDCWQFDWPEENEQKICMCGEAVCDCNQTKDVHISCKVCEGPCMCQELDRIFLNELNINLEKQQKLVHRACETEPEKIKKLPEVGQFCIICGHNDCNCKTLRENTKKGFPFLEFNKDSAKSSLKDKTESQLQLKQRIDNLLKNAPTKPHQTKSKIEFQPFYMSSDESLRQPTRSKASFVLSTQDNSLSKETSKVIKHQNIQIQETLKELTESESQKEMGKNNKIKETTLPQLSDRMSMDYYYCNQLFESKT